MDLEMMCQTTLSRHRARVDEAARRCRLRNDDKLTTTGGRRSVRWSLAAALRRMADALEPQASEPRVLLLRAVSHREIDVEQAMRLLERANGHRSPSR